jgi:hypothetical protein
VIPELQQAAAHLLEAGLRARQFSAAAKKRGSEDLPALARLQKEYHIEFPLAAPLYDRALFLFSIETAAERAGLALSADAAAELAAIAAARAEFEAAHPPCAHCGERQSSAREFSCWNCLKKIGGA